MVLLNSYFEVYISIWFRQKRIRGVMVGMLALSTIDLGSSVGHTKEYKIGIYCFSAKHAALRRKSKEWLAQNQNNVSELSNM